MTQRQKTFLIALALIDLIVVGVVVGTIIRNMGPATPPLTQVLPCTQALLKSFPTNWQPQVSWEPASLYIMLTVEYDTAWPPRESAQLLWTILDKVAATVEGSCPPPGDLTLVVNANGRVQAWHHLAHISGDDFAAWLYHELPSDALATRATYRQISQPREFEPAPLPNQR